MAVPNTTTFSLQDVVNEINPTTDDLVDCVADATLGQYDATYFTAPATSLLEFRNYGAITSEGPLLPSTGATGGGAGDAWSNPTRIQNDTGDDAANSASSFISASGTSEYLNATNFGFAVAGTPVGIEVEISRSPSVGAETYAFDNTVQLIVGGAGAGSNKAVGPTWASGYSHITYGGPTDLWGLTPSTAQVNASNFGVRLSVDNTNVGSGVNVFVAHIKVTIYW